MRQEPVEIAKRGLRVERISSSLTFFYKFLFTSVWTGGFGFGTTLMFLSDSPEAHAHQWEFAGAWVIGTAVLWWCCAGLKQVDLSGNALIVSNFLRKIALPIGELAKVRQNLLINIRPVTITFRSETPFGSRVVFMPHTSFRIFGEDDIVRKLRKLAVAARKPQD